MKPKLYLFVGYPGAGKTTVARIIAQASGAVHIWTDHERLKMFDQPTHSQSENDALYKHLNEKTASLLENGRSVVFDTNFNLHKDRDYLQQIAAQKGADTLVIWVNTPQQVAQNRAVGEANLRNGYDFLMSADDFKRIASHLEPPTETEKVIKIDGTELDEEELLRLLNL